MIKSKALVAMSGGVDSAVAALLLKDDYDLTGVTMRLWDDKCTIPESLSAAPDQNCIDARSVAEALGFPHLSIALGDSFRRCVVDNFIETYKNGGTPNPCVDCNKHIKFGRLFEIADQLAHPFLATGHYARITCAPNGTFELRKALDVTKDQSYFLWGIERSRLSSILFPLGSKTKSEIRAIAEKHSLASAHKSDSQDICFIPDGDYASFMEKYSTSGDHCFTKGNFIDIEGNILGEHQGLERYTIGQRKGLGIALGVPMFVGKKNVCDRTVTLCTDNELYSKELSAHSLNLLCDLPTEKELRVEAKIRYRHAPSPATIRIEECGRISLSFDQPQRAIASGQSVVLYDGDLLLGGAIIE